MSAVISQLGLQTDSIEHTVLQPAPPPLSLSLSVCVCVRERERERERARERERERERESESELELELFIVSNTWGVCTRGAGSNKQFNSSSDISFGKSLSKLYTGEGGGGGGGGEQ